MWFLVPSLVRDTIVTKVLACHQEYEEVHLELRTSYSKLQQQAQGISIGQSFCVDDLLIMCGSSLQAKFYYLILDSMPLPQQIVPSLKASSSP